MCRWCGETDLELLQFDHVGGWKPQPVKKPNQLTRIRELWRDYVAWREFGVGGPIQVLCEKCNGWDGRHRQQENEVRRRRLGAVRKARRWRRATG